MVVDESGLLSPGPLTPFDVHAQRPHVVLRAGAPAERDHPFTVFDAIVPRSTAVREAVGRARGNHIFLVANIRVVDGRAQSAAELDPLDLPGYRRVAAVTYPAFFSGVQVQAYAPAG